MTWTQTWIIDGRHIATAPIGFEHIHAQQYPPYAKAYFCPTCGEVWGRRIIIPHTQWTVFTRHCKKHEPYSVYLEPGGSVWSQLDTEMLKHLPKAMYHYETLLRLELDKND